VQNVHEDYSFWQSLSTNDQAVAVRSAIDAYTAGMTFGAAEFAVSAGESASAAQGISLKLIPKFSHTIGYYIASISDFYETHPNAQHVTIGAFMACLQDSPRVTCDEVAKMVESSH
jgi:hypothetical protein